MATSSIATTSPTFKTIRGTISGLTYNPISYDQFGYYLYVWNGSAWVVHGSFYTWTDSSVSGYSTYHDATSLAPSHYYYIEGWAKYNGTWYACGNSSSVLTDMFGAPGAPTLVNRYATSLELTWNNSADTISGYQVYMSADGGSTYPYNSTYPTSKPYTWSSLTEGTTYKHKVRGYYEDGDGTYWYIDSSANDGTTLPKTPTLAKHNNNADNTLTTVYVELSGMHGLWDKVKLYFHSGALARDDCDMEGTWDITGLTAGSSYVIYGIAQKTVNGVIIYSAQSDEVTSVGTKLATPSYPTLNSRAETSLNVSCGSVSGAYNYNFRHKPYGGSTWTYLNGQSNTNVTLSGLTGGIQYELQAQANSTFAPDSDWSASSYGSTNPMVANLTHGSPSSTPGAGNIFVHFDNMTNGWDWVRVWWKKTTDANYSSYQDCSINGTWELPNCVVNTNYVVKCKTYWYINSTQLYSPEYTYPYAILCEAATRPSNWAWTTTIVEGGNTYGSNNKNIKIITATEWNNFRTFVKNMGLYKAAQPYTFTNVSVGDGVTAATYNDVRTYIWGYLRTYMTGSYVNGAQIPAAVTANVTHITANHFNKLKDSLNSIT